jgi:hypothetical protein
MKKHLQGVAVAAPLLVLACQQILSIDGAVTIAGPVDACGLSVPEGSCQRCVAASCCAQASSCGQDPSCAKYESCLLGCGGDYACRSSCVLANPIGGAPDVPTFDQCVAATCAEPCGVSCGVVGSYTEPDAAQACQDCISAHVCMPSETCTTNLACELVAHCAYSCVTPDCQAACVAMDDAGTFTSLAFGVGSTCISDCQVGQYWPCVGRVTWPLANTTPIDVTVTVLDSTTRVPIKGVAIKACTRGDAMCSSPVDTKTTDAGGEATLTIPVPGHLGFEGYFDLTSPAILHNLYFLGYPLTAPNGQVSVLAVSQSSFTSLVSVLKGVTIDSVGRGTVAVAASDCLLLGAPGVSFSATGTDGQTTLAYLQGGILSTTATATDASGLAFYLNAPPGQFAIDATPQPIGRVSSRVSVFVEPGAISFVQALPTP